MARRVFFSFHYEADVWRANVVRNSWMAKGDREEAGFWDASLREEAKRRGDLAVKRMIDRGLEGTSVTAVLIGAETAARDWVTYEVVQSFNRGSGLLGIFIDGIEDQFGRRCSRGPNPLDHVYTEQGGRRVRLSSLFRTYDWVRDRGYWSLGGWVEDAMSRG